MATSISDQLMAKHPLQWMKAPSRGASAILHLIGVCSFSFSFWWLWTSETSISASYGSNFQHLTNLGLLVSYIAFIFGLLADITLSPKLFMIKNVLAMCSAPLEVLISLLFWTIFFYDRKLLMSPEILATLNHYANISFHLNPSILWIIDLLFFSPPWTIQALPAMGLSSCIAFAYWGWVEHCYTHNGWYAYPLFGVLNTQQRIVLFIGAAQLMTACTFLLQWMYGRVNGLRGAQNRATPANIKGE